MEWILAAVAGTVVYAFGRSRGWWGSLFAGKGGTAVYDLESDMPDALKTQVLGTLASSTDPTTLDQLATTLTMGLYLQAAYDCRLRAWELRGSVGQPPTPPTAQELALAQSQRAAMSLGQPGAGAPAPADVIAAASAAPATATAGMRREVS